MGTCFLVLGAGQEVLDIEDDKPYGVDAVIAASGGPEGAQSALLSSVKFSPCLSAIESEISPQIQGFSSNDFFPAPAPSEPRMICITVLCWRETQLRETTGDRALMRRCRPARISVSLSNKNSLSLSLSGGRRRFLGGTSFGCITKTEKSRKRFGA